MFKPQWSFPEVEGGLRAEMVVQLDFEPCCPLLGILGGRRLAQTTMESPLKTP